MLRTKLCELLDIEAPIISAPMGPEISGLELAAAVSDAGGLGIISFGGYAPQALRERIRKLCTLTSRPFGEEPGNGAVTRTRGEGLRPDARRALRRQRGN